MTRRDGVKKGIKLDFKLLAAVEPSLALLTLLLLDASQLLLPIWLNADILPLAGTAGHVDGDSFLSLCQTYLPRYTPLPVSGRQNYK